MALDLDYLEEAVGEAAAAAEWYCGRRARDALAWSWRLSEATPAQRASWELIGDGHGVYWPDVDEDISAEGMLRGDVRRAV